MKQYRAFVGLGSNVGDRLGFLNAAAGQLATMQDVRLVWCSSVYETAPMGKTDQAMFLNAVAELETALTPRELLPRLQAVEQSVGRTPGERWGPREIDLDILLYDGLVFADERLTVPHPELEKRRFVLVPLREIAPDMVHPVSGMTMEELANAVRAEGRVSRTSYRLKY